MSTIACGACGRSSPSDALVCGACGASLEALTELPEVSLKSRVTAGVDSLTKIGKGLLRSKKEVDADAVSAMADRFRSLPQEPLSVADKERERFKGALDSTIDIKFAEVMKGRSDADRFLTYVDGQILTAAVRNVFKNALGSAPPEVEAACSLSEALLAPTAEETERLVKAAIGIGGGAAGIAMIITAVGVALGWGTGVIAGVTAFFVGSSFAGPVGWTIAGVTLAGIAGYFATSSNEHSDTERFVLMLKSANGRAVDAIWEKNQAALIRAMRDKVGA